MTASIHLQWTYAPSTARPITLADIILPRVLERYGLHTPTRTNLQFRTYRASSSSSSSSTTTSTPSEPIQRYLTIITYLPTAPGQGDDVSYLFMDDRGANDNVTMDLEKEKEIQNEGKVDRTQVDQPPAQTVVSDTKTDNGNGQKEGGNLIDDGFEIIDVDADVPSTEGSKSKVTEETSAPARTPIPIKAETEPISASTSQERKVENSGEKLGSRRQSQRYQILAIRPGNNIVPILQALLSPFVLGITKSARVTASTTNSTPIPTPLPGTSLLLTCLSFTYIPLSSPFDISHRNGNGNERLRDKSIILKIYILPNPNAQSIFLQAEFTDTNNNKNNTSIESESNIIDEQNVLKEFLEDCLPSSPSPSSISIGEKRYISDFMDRDKDGRLGEVDKIERNKQNMFTLAKMLRQGGFI